MNHTDIVITFDLIRVVDVCHIPGQAQVDLRGLHPIEKGSWRKLRAWVFVLGFEKLEELRKKQIRIEQKQ